MSTTCEKRLRTAHQPTGQWIRTEKRLAIYLRDGFACLYCARLLKGETPAEVTLDHLKPRCAGGTNDPSNLVTACRSCNSSRRDTPWLDYATSEARGRILRHAYSPLNMKLARALVTGTAGDVEIEGVR